MIICAYSYSGGSGRSTMVASLAVLLWRRGYRILVVDLSLTAPVQMNLLRPLSGRLGEEDGMVEMLQQLSHGPGTPPWREFTTPTRSTLPSFDVLTAGRQDARYADRVLQLKWPELFESGDALTFFESMRIDWRDEYDFVLVDSAGGISDLAALCCIQLADVVLAITDRHSSTMEATAGILHRVQDARARFAFDRHPATVVPLISRLDVGADRSVADWRAGFSTSFERFTDSWLPADVRLSDVAGALVLPFNGDVDGRSAQSMWDTSEDGWPGTRLSTVADLLESEMSAVDQLLAARPASAPTPPEVADFAAGSAISAGTDAGGTAGRDVAVEGERLGEVEARSAGSDREVGSTGHANANRLRAEWSARTFRVQVPPIGSTTVAAIANDLLGVPASADLLELAAVAAGDPGVLADLVRGMLDEGFVEVTPTEARLLESRLPASTRAHLHRLITHLSSEARQLVQVASLIGERSDLDVLSALLDTTAIALIPAVTEATEANLLRHDDETVRFTHELVREFVRELVPSAVRRPVRDAAARLAGTERREHREPATLEALTPAELAVARLVRSGMTNRQAASHLHISPHTVNYHLRSVYRKLAIQGRVELARLMLLESPSQGSA